MNTHDTPGMAGFHTTRWSVVLAARRRRNTDFSAGINEPAESSSADESCEPMEPAAQQALRDLCADYWQPVYSFLRRMGHNPDEAMDYTQGFIVSLLERGHVGTPDPSRGRFRTYLLGALRHHLMDQGDRARALKRGGEVEIQPLVHDAATAEQAYEQCTSELDSPERVYLRRWGLLTLDTARQRLRQAYSEDGKVELFDALADGIGGPPQLAPMAERAAQLGLSSDALKMALSRLRRRFGQSLRTLIAETVDNPADIDAEIQFLIAAVS